MPSRPLLPSAHLARHRLLSSSSPPPLGKPQLILVVVVAIAALAATLLVVFFTVCCYRRRRQQIVGKKSAPERDDVIKIRRYNYRQLKRATKSFSPNRKLGKGGFGVVYRGLLSDGKEVAVKKLDHMSLQGEREFQNELFICSGLDSPYVVNLLGYCTRGEKLRLLVYECMGNRSLQEALFDKNHSVRLDWNKRFKIIRDTAKGLEFLHVGCNPPIIHGDIKPSNILLDHDFSARIGDFGLARFKSEALGFESARFSASSEKYKQPDTPERFRFGLVDHTSPGTPEMSRSSTSRNPFSECSCKGTDSDHSKKIQPLNREAFVGLDTIPSNRLCEKEDTASVIEAMPSSPNCNDTAGQGSSMVDEYGMSTYATSEIDHDHTPAKGMLNGHFDGKVANNNLPVGSTKAILQESVTGNAQSPTVIELSLAKNGAPSALWRKQGENGNLSGKEYVLDWLGSELNENGHSSCDTVRAEAVSPNPTMSEAHGGKNMLGDKETCAERVRKEKKKVKSVSKKGREWWKDEYFAELSGKSDSAEVLGGKRKNRKNTLDNWKDYLSADLTSNSGELRADIRSVKGSGKGSSKEWFRSMRSGELTLSGAVERQRVPSVISDLFNEERRCHYSSELINGQWSGELTKSGELVSKDASSTTSMRGTVCYVAPEYGGNGVLSEKSDIYSFGVLMLVILSGRRPIQVSAAPMKEFERANLISWARNLSQHGKLLDLIDAGLHGEYDREEAVLCITLALLCLQRVPSTRPHISEIVKILSREMAVPNLPLELSPSPPARIQYKLPNRSPKVHLAQINSATPSKEGIPVL